MKNQIISLGEKNQKSMVIDDDRIIVSSKSYSAVDGLRAAAEKKGLLESVKVIPMSGIKEVNYNETTSNFEVKYSVEGKDKKETIVLEDNSMREEVVNTIATNKGFTKLEEQESKIKPLLFNLFWVIFIPILTWVCRGMALDAESGVHYEASGRRSGIKQLLANVVETLGPTWVTVIGVLATVYMIYVAYRRYTHPASQFIFK